MAEPVESTSEQPRKPHKVSEHDRVPLKEKIAYGAGGIGNGITDTADARVMAPVFVVAMGVSPSMMSLCGLIYRAWDAITDALMGWISDNTRTRWGRRRPYVFIGAFLVSIAMPLVFFFDRNWDLNWIIAWMIGFSLLLYTMNTIYNVPYQSMLLECSADSNERTNVAAWRAYFGMVTQFVVAWIWWATQLPIFHNDLGEVDVLYGARWVISGMAVIAIILSVMPAIFMKERFYHKSKDQAKVSLKDNFRLTFKSKPFLWLMAFIVFFSVGFNMKWGLDFYTKLYYVCGGDQMLASKLTGVQGSLQVVVSLAGIPIFQWLANRIGKRQTMTIIVSIVFFSSLSTLLLYTPTMPYLSILPSLLVAPAATAIWVIVPSMTGDIVDDDELATGERREGAYASIFSWMLKMTLTGATALSGPLVELAGFRTEIRDNLPVDVLLNMRMVLAIGPAVLVGIAFFVLLRYPLTTNRIDNIREKLEARRGEI